MAEDCRIHLEWDEQMSTRVDYLFLQDITAASLTIYQSLRITRPLAVRAIEILEQVNILMQSVGVSYLEAGQRLELPHLPEASQPTSVEQIAASYRDVQLRFEGLKAAVYDLGKALLDDEHTCEQGAALIDALVAIAPDHRDVKTLQQFARHFVPACAALSREDWEAARKGFEQALKLVPKHSRASTLYRDSYMIPSRRALDNEQWGAANGLLEAWLRVAPNDGESQLFQRESHMGMINEAFRGEKWQDAQNYLATWLRSHPDDHEARALQRVSHMQPAKAAIESGQWQDGQNRLQSWLRIAPSDSEALNLVAPAVYGEASSLLKRGDWQQAAQKYQQTSSSGSPHADQLKALLHQYPGFVWHLGKPPTPRILAGHSGPVHSVIWSADGRRLATAGSDATVRIWDTASGKLQQTLSGHKAGVLGVSWNPEGTQLASGGRDGLIHIWDIASGSSVEQIEAWMQQEVTQLAKDVTCVAWSPDGFRLAWGGAFRLRIYDFYPQGTLRTLDGHGHSPWVASIAWDSNGSRLVSGGWDGTLRVWDAATARCVQAITAITPDEIAEVEGARSRLVHAGVQYGWSSAEYVRLQRQCELYEAVSVSGYLPRISSVTWTPDRTTVVSGSAYGWTKTWDVNSGKMARKLTYQLLPVLGVTWSSDNARLACACSDQSITIFDIRSGGCTHCLSGHAERVNAVAWSPDSSQLASASSDGTVRIWGYQ
jgi:WD40 repeat protein